MGRRRDTCGCLHIVCIHLHVCGCVFYNKYSVDRKCLMEIHLCGHNPNFVDFVASHKVISGGLNRLPKVLGCHSSLVSVTIITLRYIAHCLSQVA